MKISARIMAVLLMGCAMVFAVGRPAFAAKPADNARPGWGLGDKNHIHTGPPGLSVRVDSTVSQNANVGNAVMVTAGSGGNSGGQGSIVTGAVAIAVSVVNSVNHLFSRILG